MTINKADQQKQIIFRSIIRLGLTIVTCTIPVHGRRFCLAGTWIYESFQTPQWAHHAIGSSGQALPECVLLFCLNQSCSIILEVHTWGWSRLNSLFLVTPKVVWLLKTASQNYIASTSWESVPFTCQDASHLIEIHFSPRFCELVKISVSLPTSSFLTFMRC